MQYVYSTSKNSFYPVDLKERYQVAGTWPDDGIDGMSVFSRSSQQKRPPLIWCVLLVMTGYPVGKNATRLNIGNSSGG